MEKSQRSDSNRQPLVYKTRALPLSYVGVHPWSSKLASNLPKTARIFKPLAWHPANLRGGIGGFSDSA